MTIPQLNNLKDVMAFIYIDERFIGCAVIFKNDDKLLLVTAYHVLKPISDDLTNNLCKIKVKSELGDCFFVDEEAGGSKFCIDTDIILLFLKGNGCHLREVLFFNDVLDSEIYLISRMKSKNMETPANFYPKQQVEHCDDSFFLITAADKTLLEDSSGRLGASALGGISGSGVFLGTHQHLVLVGVISSIPDEAMLAKIKCCNSNGFIELEPSLKTPEKMGYDFGNSAIINSVNLLNQDNLDAVIEEWENNLDNKEYITNINRKLDVLHKEEKVALEKRKVMSNLMVGDELYNVKIKNSPEVEKAYSYSHNIFCGEDMSVYANGRIEANNKYHEIKSNYLDILENSLCPVGLRKDDILLLRNKDIAFWLANCDLDFMDKDDD